MNQNSIRQLSKYFLLLKMEWIYFLLLKEELLRKFFFCIIMNNNRNSSHKYKQSKVHKDIVKQDEDSNTISNYVDLEKDTHVKIINVQDHPSIWNEHIFSCQPKVVLIPLYSNSILIVLSWGINWQVPIWCQYLVDYKW